MVGTVGGGRDACDGRDGWDGWDGRDGRDGVGRVSLQSFELGRSGVRAAGPLLLKGSGEVPDYSCQRQMLAALGFNCTSLGLLTTSVWNLLQRFAKGSTFCWRWKCSLGHLLSLGLPNGLRLWSCSFFCMENSLVT